MKTILFFLFVCCSPALYSQLPIEGKTYRLYMGWEGDLKSKSTSEDVSGEIIKSSGFVIIQPKEIDFLFLSKNDIYPYVIFVETDYVEEISENRLSAVRFWGRDDLKQKVYVDVLLSDGGAQVFIDYPELNRSRYYMMFD